MDLRIFDMTLQNVADDINLNCFCNKGLLSQEPELDESEHTWADRNTNRPETKVNIKIINNKFFFISVI